MRRNQPALHNGLRETRVAAFHEKVERVLHSYPKDRVEFDFI